MTARLAKRLFAGVVTSFLSLVASASPELSGTITELYVNDINHPNVIFISVGASFTSSCGLTSTYLVMDITDQSMKAAYAMALGAFLSGHSVHMGGIGACYGTAEMLRYIYVTQ